MSTPKYAPETDIRVVCPRFPLDHSNGLIISRDSMKTSIRRFAVASIGTGVYYKYNTATSKFLLIDDFVITAIEV
jgi:hypothetical protein